jgi:hypothetical protein
MPDRGFGDLILIVAVSGNKLVIAGKAIDHKVEECIAGGDPIYTIRQR